MDVALERPTIKTRKERKKRLQRTEAAYENAVLNKLAALIDSDGSPEAALELGQMPNLLQKASFTGQPIELKDLAVNHLHLLMDVALQEHAARRQTVDANKRRDLLERFKNNRGLHIFIAGLIFGASVIPEVAPVPRPEEIITQYTEDTLRLISAAIFTYDTPELLRLRYLDHRNNKQADKLEAMLIEDKYLSDLTLRVVFGVSHYGSSQGNLTHSHRFGSDDPKLNAQMLADIDAQLAYMQSDPGGRPYTGRQALGYAGRFLIERSAQVQDIGRKDFAAIQRQRYLTLSRQILQEDLDRMKRGLTVSRTRKNIMKIVALGATPFMGNDLAAASDATTASRDVVSHTVGKRDKKQK